jgi:cobalt-zinc-cadmium efflux system outer membrane protein
LNIPPELPGSEAPRIQIPTERAAGEREIARIYPELPPPPVEPEVVPGPDGKPYTLADFQRLAAANSPALRQAASDVEAAKGNLIQAKTYPNPIVSYLVDPSNNNSTAGVQGGAIDQPIITGGKMRLGVAAAQRDLDNAILALKRARSDLSTAVRNAYFTVLVDIETLVVTRAQARLADDIFRLQVGLQRGTQAAPYEPTALRAQAFTNRLAYKQAIASYIYDWKALVATIGLQQLPLSEVAGRVDRLIPYFDYDEVLAHVLHNHTDILTAQNVVKKSQYILKVAQVTPVFPNLDVRYSLEKDFVLGPFGTYQTLALGFPLSIWDQNKGNIIAAQAGLVRAGEEAHRVQVTLTSGLALAYESYRNNLYAMEYYRRYILPDLVSYYRGIFARRQIDPSSSFGDLVFAQQNLSTNVTAYIGILGSLWASVVSVADYLQTDDLFQLARPHELPELPDLSQLPAIWACGHGAVCATPSGVSDAAVAAPPAGLPFAPPAGLVPLSRATGSSPPQPPRAGAGGASQPPKEKNHEGQDS